MRLIEMRINDRRILKLVRKWLEAGVMEGAQFHETNVGSPQGGVISPLLSNIYLNYLDTVWMKHFAHLGELVRFADDLVILCKTKKQALESIEVIKTIISKLDLTINREKSKLVNIWDNKDGFDFLGFHNRKFPVLNKGGSKVFVLAHIPSKKAMRNMRAKIKEFTEPRNKLYWNMEDMIEGLNRKVTGFRNYYLLSPVARKWINRIDWYILERLALFWNKKKNRRKKHARMGEVIKLTNEKLKKLAS